MAKVLLDTGMRPRIKDATKVTLSIERRVKDLGRDLADARGLSFTGLVEALIMEDARKRGGHSVQTLQFPLSARVPGDQNEGQEKTHIPAAAIPASYLDRVAVVRATKDPFYPVSDSNLAFRTGDLLVVVEGESPRPGDVALMQEGKRTTLAEVSNVGQYRPIFNGDDLGETPEPVGIVWCVVQSA